MGILSGIFPDYTVGVVVSGSLLLGLTAGACGAVVFVRKESLLADTVSHACLPGVVLGFMAAGSKHHLALLAGAFATAFLAAVFVRIAFSAPVIKFDSALALGTSISFGTGVVLLTAVQSGGASGQAGLDRFLFGQASAMSIGNVKTIFLLGAACAAALAVFWKQVKVVCFDPEYAQSAGFRTRASGFFLNTVLVSAVVAGIETVGVVLMCSMLVAPPVAARHVTGGFGRMVFCSSVFGALGGVLGAAASWKLSVPTGPAIVLSVTALALFSMAFAARRAGRAPV